MNLTDNSERASELVYEALTGECWHDAVKWNSQCWKCSKCKDIFRLSKPNPKLLTSLDAWRPLWERMDERGLLHVQELMEIVDPTVRINKHGMYELITGELYLLMQAQPIHHLEAALRALEDGCCGEDGCDGVGQIWQPKDEVYPVDDSGTWVDCSTCKGTGKVSLYELWEGEERPCTG